VTLAELAAHASSPARMHATSSSEMHARNLVDERACIRCHG
jgi:hypothetical protein